ncbi:O-antigen ligase family protein, partial [Peribacillus butanolivorans]|uniref:O-antigen ligase family protein n=1 Tax=Peribacillus butanolivorans TaxID=421767 RepID=UPI00366254EB
LSNFSLMELCLVSYIVIIFINAIYKNYRINIFVFLIVIFSIVFLIIGVFISLDSLESFKNTLNLILFILVILATFLYVDNNSMIKKEEIDNYINMYISVCISLAIGLFFQYLALYTFNLELGEIFTFSERTIFNLYFIPKSTLSAFVCSGAIILLIRLYKNFKIRNFFVFSLLLFANIINTSRTGLVVLILVFTLYVIMNTKYIFKNYKTFLLIFILIFSFVGAAELLLESRTTTDLLDDNGRFDLIINSKDVLKDNLILGIGSSWADLHKHGITMEIHNFVIQYILQMGIIVTISLLALLFYILKKLRYSEYFYVVLYICLAGTFYTYWHNSLFINPVMIIGIICSKNNYRLL